MSHTIQHSVTDMTLLFMVIKSKTTKSAKQQYRVSESVPRDILNDGDIRTVTTQAVFHANSRNKDKLFYMLNEELKPNGVIIQ